ncbi:peptidase M48, partial [Pseudomonas syringae]
GVRCRWLGARRAACGRNVVMVVRVLVAGCRYTVWRVGEQLGVRRQLFEPTAMQVLGQPVTPEEAPVLWAYVRDLAERLGALSPDHIVLGMPEGFYVTSSDGSLLPPDAVPKGRTRHVPSLYPALIDAAETSAVSGHELAHFACEDPAAHPRFLPLSQR